MTISDRATGQSEAPTGVLSPDQIEFYQIFGFLSVPGLLVSDIDEISDAFDSVFATSVPKVIPADDPLHWPTDPDGGPPRQAVADVHRRHARLRELSEDPRLVDVAEELLDGPVELNNTNGNRFSCNVTWHPDDIFVSPPDDQVKVFMYLDPVTSESGALRVVPMSFDPSCGSAGRLRNHMLDSMVCGGTNETLLGVSVRDLPSWSIESKPGDVHFVDVRTLHASFGGGVNRRLLAIGYQPSTGDATDSVDA